MSCCVSVAFSTLPIAREVANFYDPSLTERDLYAHQGNNESSGATPTGSAGKSDS